MVDDMAHAGLIQKYHCELLRKDTNSLASYFNSNTRANLLWLGIGRGNLTGCHPASRTAAARKAGGLGLFFLPETAHVSVFPQKLLT